MRRIVLLVLVVVAAVLSRIGSKSRPTPGVGASQESAAAAPTVRPGGAAAAPTVGVTRPNIGFRTRRNLEEHFAKHGAEFGGATMEQYLVMAQALRDAPPGGDVLELVRPLDGVVSRFDRKRGAFLAFDRDGTIHTFFRPNDGEAYFRRQANRSPNR